MARPNHVRPKPVPATGTRPTPKRPAYDRTGGPGGARGTGKISHAPGGHR